MINYGYGYPLDDASVTVVDVTQMSLWSLQSKSGQTHNTQIFHSPSFSLVWFVSFSELSAQSGDLGIYMMFTEKSSSPAVFIIYRILGCPVGMQREERCKLKSILFIITAACHKSSRDRGLNNPVFSPETLFQVPPDWLNMSQKAILFWPQTMTRQSLEWNCHSKDVAFLDHTNAAGNAEWFLVTCTFSSPTLCQWGLRAEGATTDAGGGPLLHGQFRLLFPISIIIVIVAR